MKNSVRKLRSAKNARIEIEILIPQRPYIRFRSISQPLEDLRTHKEGTSYNRIHYLVFVVSLEYFRETKVTYFDSKIVHKNIFRLQISVNYIKFIKFFVAINNLRNKVDSYFFRN